jgi:hypothetical protein
MSDRYSYDWSDPTGKRITPDKMVRKILAGEIHRKELKLVAVFDTYQADGYNIQMMGPAIRSDDGVYDDNVYRVSIFPDGVDVIGFGLFGVDSFFEGHYSRPDDLPEWVKERLAVLMITSATPPTQEVEGVGRRISSHVFWVYAPERT